MVKVVDSVINSVQYECLRDVRGRVVNVVDFKSLAPHRCGSESQQGLWILSCEEAIQLAYGSRWFYSGASSCLKYARKATWGLPPPVKLESRDMTYTVSMWRKTQKQNLGSTTFYDIHV
jgi:hypothetical protein